MTITFNPNAAAHNPNARPAQTQTTPTPTVPEGSDDGVVISLSPAAKQALEAGAAEYTGNSPAQQARQALTAGEFAFAEGGDDSHTPFGQIVKTFAPGHNKGTAGTDDAVPEDGSETAGVTEPTDGGDGTGEVADGGDGTTVVEGSDGTDGTDVTDGTGVVEGSDGSDGGDSTVVAGDPDETVGTDDPLLVVDEPDVTEVLDESAPADGEVTEPESGIAGSGDAVASTGDDAPVGDGTPVDSDEPVTVVDTGVVDTGDVADDLLDLLDEGSEEIV
jgi:hypothetical protein